MKDPFEKQLDGSSLFKTNVLDGLPKREWPGRIDYVAERIAQDNYMIGPRSGGEILFSGTGLDKAAQEYYLEGISTLTGDQSRKTALPNNFNLGSLLVQFAGLRNGLTDIGTEDVPPGEIIARLIMRTAQRQARGHQAEVARQLRTDVETPRELVAELTTAPELSSVVSEAVPDADDPSTLTSELASLDLTTELWNHQLESLALWLYHGRNGYVDMATATGKTVLGLAAVALSVDSGSLHPADQERLGSFLDGNIPTPSTHRPNDVLIVTTDDLLGVQWTRLFEEHCHTPSEFTQVTDAGIQLPGTQIDIRSARSLEGVDPSDYRVVIFDEVHNYKTRSGWGENLVRFVESSCPVLALTGSVTEELESLVRRTDEPFPVVYRYTHERALTDGVIPDFEWTLDFTTVEDGDTLGRFQKTAAQFKKLVTYESGTYQITDDRLQAVEPGLSPEIRSEIAGDYPSGVAVASTLRDTGDSGQAPTEWLDDFASGISNRTLNRLNLATNLDRVREMAEDAVAAGRPALVLTRSYEEAKRLSGQLRGETGDVVVRRLESGQSAKEQADTIRAFDDDETERKMLIGPGKRIGQGNDIHSVEVGINIAQPGSGVNATLVQRLGRLLRDAEHKETVQFYHVMGVPPSGAVVEPDGESFVQAVAGFFSQVLEPDTDGILKVPHVAVADDVTADVATLERLGAPSLDVSDRATILESSYAAAISETEVGKPAVDTGWFSAAFGDASRAGTSSRVPGERDWADPARDITDNQSETDSTDPISPLAEHYDALRSLAIIHRGLLDSGLESIDESDPFRRWVGRVRQIVNEEGFGDQSVGYGPQLKKTDEINVEEYRNVRGNGRRVTTFESIEVTSPPPSVLGLLEERLSDLAEWYIPLAPDSGVPLPVLVESEAELKRGEALLQEFDKMPPPRRDGQNRSGQEDYRDDSGSTERQSKTEACEQSTGKDSAKDTGDDTTEKRPSDEAQTTAGIASEDKSQKDESSTPVAEIRGVSTSAAESLRSAGYSTLSDLRMASDADLEAVDGISSQRVVLIRASVGSV